MKVSKEAMVGLWVALDRFMNADVDADFRIHKAQAEKLATVLSQRSDLRVTDYKTGRDFTKRNMVVGGGEMLQPVIYGLAVEHLMAARVVQSRLYYCTRAGGFADRVVPMQEEARARGPQVLGLILIQVVIKGTALVVKDIDPSQIEGLVLGTVVVLAVALNQRVRGRE